MTDAALGRHYAWRRTESFRQLRPRVIIARSLNGVRTSDGNCRTMSTQETP